MDGVRFYYSRGYDYGSVLPLRQVHGFVLDKPRRIRNALRRQLGLGRADFLAPQSASPADLERVHAPEHLAAVERSADVATALEMPPLRFAPRWLIRRAVVAPQRLASGGTLAALMAARDGDWAFNLSGGFHHARPALAHGFCLVADVGVAVEAARAGGWHPKVLVVDLDLHQGDGNAAVFAGDPEVFTVSVHEGGAFPHPKLDSDLDVPLRASTGTAVYLAAVDETLRAAGDAFAPDVLVYVAGTDPFEDDPMGSLRVSAEGLVERDRRVARFARELGCALVALPAGGYTPRSPELSAAGFAAMAELRR